MGISIPTRLATVATPSVHLEMALELLARAGSGFDRVVIAAEPLFLKEMGETALREKGPGFADQVVACFVGGEWVAESWRRYVSELFGFPEEPSPRVGVLVSMGAAEVGLHVLHETPALREARQALDSPLARMALFGRDPGYSPTLLTWDPNRLYMEERRHSDGVSTLVLTALTRRLLPLVRYDLDDEAELLDAAAANRELTRQGSDARLEGPAVALWGRRGAARSGARAGACAPRSSRRGSSPRRPTPARSPAASASRPTRAARCSTCSCARTCAPAPASRPPCATPCPSPPGCPPRCASTTTRTTRSTTPGTSSTSRSYLERARVTEVRARARRRGPPRPRRSTSSLSDRVEDVDEALAVVHDGFVEAGYTLPRSPRAGGCTPSYLNPGTIFAVARIDGEPVGAAVLVADGPFGLPSDRAFAEENDALRALGSGPMLECGSFVVAAPWRRHTRRVFVRVIAALIRVALDEFPDSPGS